MKYLLTLSVAAILALARLGMAQTSPLYVTDGDSSRLAIVQGGALQSVKTTHNKGYPIVVGTSLWIGDYNGTQPNAIEYTLAGNPTGLTVPYTPIFAVDGATDGVNAFQLGSAFSGLGTVYRGGLQFQASVPLFNVPGTDIVGITYDSVAGTLWVSGNSIIYQYSTAGALLSSFAHGSGRGCIAYEAATNTIWYVRNSSNIIDQYSKAGALLQSLTIAGLASNNWGAEFAASANTPPTITQLGPIARSQGQSAVVGIATVSDGQDAAGTLTVTAAPPAGITVTGITNTAGAITANVTASCAATVGANTVVLTVTDSGGLQATANLVVNVAATVIVVSPASLPLPVVLTPYSQTITASGGTGPYTFAVTAGALPPGLTLTPAGLLSGTPTTVGAFNFTITATDFNGCTGSRAYGTTTQKISATVVLSSAPNASKPGESVTFKATIVSPVATAPPSGPVQFRDGATLLGSGTLNLLGIATFSTSTLGVGTHPITASYPGDGFYDVAQSAILNQVVSPLVTTNTTLTSSVNPSNVGQSTTFTATVSPSSATGTVTFKDGSTTLGTGTMAGGIATYATSALTAGSHSITAVYGGDASNAGSTSSTLPQTVNLLATTTSVASSKNPSLVGASITFTATVVPAAATGTVTFKDGATTLGTGTLSGGTAALSTSALAVGIHPITVVYGGDASYATSTSSSLSQSITNVGGCTSGGTDTLCVQSNGRFTVKVAWTNQYNGNQTGVGTATAVTSDSGFFTFFSANNIELVIKVLDGRSVNGKYWVLYGALSDVGYTITVTDTQTSLVKTYVNAPGNLASVSDTGAFAGRPEEAQEALTDGPATYGQLASLQMVETAKLIDESTGGRAQLADDGACTTSGGTLCLNGGRFQLTAAWKNYNDASTGTGTAIALTSDSGYFWFFSSPNVELMLKVLDGRSVNGKFWYLSGALTDVEYTVTVTDTTTGTVKTYVNPAHTLKSLIDISAF